MAYTTIDDPSAFFQATVYTGNNTANNAITNDGNSDLQPDFIFSSYRTTPPYTNHRCIIDSSRGRREILESDTTAAEVTSGAGNNDLQSFDTDGFTVGLVNSTSSLNAGNTSTVAWQWKANGGTTASNSDGSTTATVQANTTAGFSIITWTGTGSATTLGHGLGVAPAMLIVKNRTTAVDWAVYHKDLTDAGYTLSLNTNDAEADSGTNRWNHTDPTSSVFSIGAGQQTNQNTNSMVCYAFAEKQGYSKFGKYVGNGNADGTFVYTGFKPAWVMTKETGAAGSWVIYDNKRDTFNPETKLLSAEASSAEETYTQYDFVSNGFKFRSSGSENSSGNKHIYMAFAENPFVTSTGIPTTAR